jgi:hypothetical protein
MPGYRNSFIFNASRNQLPRLQHFDQFKEIAGGHGFLCLYSLFKKDISQIFVPQKLTSKTSG